MGVPQCTPPRATAARLSAECFENQLPETLQHPLVRITIGIDEMQIAHSQRKHVTAPPALAQLQTTLDSLATASSILQGFAHRNKNQHHGTRWWGPFSMLSRCIRKLLPDLEGAVQRAEVLFSSSNSSSSAKRRKIDRSARQPELDKFTERAQWVHDVAVAKAYE